ncbi:MAG: SDR family NAD(P)-dependent oxidoreductase [Gaiellaceae bacterium]
MTSCSATSAALSTSSVRTALVTGASRGIGAAAAERLRADGWRVETAERSTGVDLSDPEAARAAVERLDRIDGLVANAGTTNRTPVLELELADWRRVLELNLTSVFVLCQAAGRRMVEQGGGAIVLVASVLSFQGGVNAAAYSASKGGVAQLAKALSNELVPHGVRVNAVAPGFTETELTSDMEDWKREEVTGRIPLGRWARPEDIAPAIAWLLSDDARYVTGTILPVDGGYLAR